MDLEKSVKKYVENNVLESRNCRKKSINAYETVIKGKNKIS